MNKTKVTKKTVSNMYRQGHGWVVSSYSTQYGGWVTSSEMNHQAACEAVKYDRETWNTKTQRYE